MEISEKFRDLKHTFSREGWGDVSKGEKTSESTDILYICGICSWGGCQLG